MRAVLVSEPSSFDAALAEVLSHIDVRCHIARVAQLPDVPKCNRTAPKTPGRPRRLAEGKDAETENVLGLTPREQQVLAAISHGCTNLEIARRLDMQEGTVKTHLHAIFRKLAVPNRAGAALCGARMIDIQQQEIDDAEQGKLNLSWLQLEMSHRRVRTGEWIFRLGDVGSELFYVQRGRVTLTEVGATVGPKEVFGEIGIFTPEHRRTCSARCETEVDLLSLSSGQIRRIYFANPQFALFILTLVATRLIADRRRGTEVDLRVEPPRFNP